MAGGVNRSAAIVIDMVVRRRWHALNDRVQMAMLGVNWRMLEESTRYDGMRCAEILCR